MPEPSAEVRGLETTFMDRETGEVITKTFGEWRDLGEKDGWYKTPIPVSTR